jgi:WD40 repeat protein
MKTTKLLFLFAFLFIFYSFVSSQTVFEDAVALNFKTDGTFHTAAYTPAGQLVTAKIVKSLGANFLEIGLFDDKGTYAKKTIIELSDDLLELKAKFNKNVDKIILFSKLTDDRIFQIADVNTGEITNDLEPGEIGNFDFSPDGNTIAFSSGNNSYLLELAEGNVIKSYKDNLFLSFNKDGSMIYCKGKNDLVNYLNTKTGEVIKSYLLKDFKSIDFEFNGELIACAYPPFLRFFKLNQTGAVEVKDYENLFSIPSFSSNFDYIVSDDNNGGKRNVYSLKEGLIYEAKIETYQPGKDRIIISPDDKKMVLLSEKKIYVYDFEMIKYFSRMSKRFADLYQTNDQFQTDQDLINRAERVKSRKDDLLNVLKDEMKVNEMNVKNIQVSSLGVVDIKLVGIGFYDPNYEMYDATLAIPVTYTSVKNVTAKVKVPKNQAEIFSNNWQKFKVTGLRIINDNLNGVYIFNVQIINDINSTVYRCIIHRTLPVHPASFDDKYNLASKNYEMRNWYDAIIYMSDFPDGFLKNSVIDVMMKNAISNYFDEKWRTVNSMNSNNVNQILIYLSDFPPTWSQYSDVEVYRKRVVNSVFDARVQKVKDMIGDKSYTEALDYLDNNVLKGLKDIYSGNVYEYENTGDVIPLKNKMYFEIGKRSIEGGNYERAIEMLKKVTQESPEYSEAQKLLSEAQNNSKK